MNIPPVFYAENVDKAYDIKKPVRFFIFENMELIQKLRLDTEKPVWVANPPDDVDVVLPGIDVRKLTGKAVPVEQLLLFATDSIELNNSLSRIGRNVGPGTLFWIFYPKKSGSIVSDLYKMEPWEFVFSLGYRGQTSVSVNDDWSGLRLTNAPRKKPSQADVPMEQRKTEGIDYVKRTVVLPPDALAVLNKHKGLADYFYSLSFSHKREHIEALVAAKKPETRARRIDKMAEMLLKMRKP